MTKVDEPNSQNKAKRILTSNNKSRSKPNIIDFTGTKDPSDANKIESVGTKSIKIHKNKVSFLRLVNHQILNSESQQDQDKLDNNFNDW